MIKSRWRVPESAPGHSLLRTGERTGWDNRDGGCERRSGERPTPRPGGREPELPAAPSVPHFPLGRPTDPPSSPPEPAVAAGERRPRPPRARSVPTPTRRPPPAAAARYLLVEAVDHGLDPFHRPVRGHVLPAAGGRRRDGAAGAQAREEGGERGPRGGERRGEGLKSAGSERSHGGGDGGPAPSREGERGRGRRRGGRGEGGGGGGPGEGRGPPGRSPH